jgi:hypothetical protein
VLSSSIGAFGLGGHYQLMPTIDQLFREVDAAGLDNEAEYGMN